MQISEIRFTEEVKQIEDMVNGPSRIEDLGRVLPYRLHNTLEQQFMRIVCGFISEVATSKTLPVDARNKKTKDLCNLIYELMKRSGIDLKTVEIPLI